jgi:hypothetical protein
MNMSFENEVAPVKGAIVNCSPLGGFAGGNKRYRVKRARCVSLHDVLPLVVTCCSRVPCAERR